MQNDLICPNCNSLLYYCLDEWGYTPWHLHCKNCSINIGATSIDKTIKLFQIYHKPNTWIEYYNNNIQILFQDNQKIINREIKNAK